MSTLPIPAFPAETVRSAHRVSGSSRCDRRRVRLRGAQATALLIATVFAGAAPALADYLGTATNRILLSERSCYTGLNGAGAVLHKQTTYVSNTGGCTHLSGVLTCNLGTITASGSSSFDVTVTVHANAPTGGRLQTAPCTGAEDICNNVSVTSDGTDSNPSDNSASQPTNVVACLTNGDCADGNFCNGVETCNAGVSSPVRRPRG